MLFLLFGAIYVIFQLVWSLAIADNFGTDLQDLTGLPGQSVSKLAIIGMLTLTATIYAIVSMWLAWRTGDQGDRPVGLFLVKQGLAMAVYICVGQILALVISLGLAAAGFTWANWASPTQGIPVMYTLCL